LPNAQYQSIASAASLSAILTQQENTFARASRFYDLVLSLLRQRFSFGDISGFSEIPRELFPPARTS